MNFKLRLLLPLCALTLLPMGNNLPAQEGSGLATKVREIFEVKCIQCHSPAATKKSAVKKWADSKDLKKLVKDYVVPGNTKDSTLWQRLTDTGDDIMPPADSKAGPLSKEQLAIVEQWIKSGAPASVEAEAPRPHISEEAALKSILEDLLKVNPQRAKTMRYFTLTHYHNNPRIPSKEIDVYREALFKMVNSLSWNRDIVKPAPVDEQKTIYRVHIADLSWTDDYWRRLTDVYPYGIVYDSSASKAIATLTSHPYPYLRADWFIAAASQPPLYHDLLGLEGPAGALAKLEAKLGIDRLKNIASLRAIRAGLPTGRSGVSKNNRLIERHTTAFGALWMSYDFSDNKGKQDLLENPLGPVGVFNPRIAFEHAGGEVIFNLPNGFQGYLLVNDKGTRLDEAPTTIVEDAGSHQAGIIFNGISCISCHSSGMRRGEKNNRDKEDAVRESLQGGKFTKAETETIESLYVSHEELTRRFDEDEKRFKTALESAGVKTFTTPDPVKQVFDKFLTEVVDLSAAAAELGLTAADLESRVGNSASGELHALLKRLKSDGVARDKFIDVFDKIIVGLSLGTHSKFKPLHFVRPGDGKLRVVVVDFEDRTGKRKNLEEQSAQQFEFILARSGRFTLQERLHLRNLKKELGEAVLSDPSAIANAGRASGADYVWFGAITNFKVNLTKPLAGGVVPIAIDTTKTEVKSIVGFSVALVNTATGEIVVKEAGEMTRTDLASVWGLRIFGIGGDAKNELEIDLDSQKKILRWGLEEAYKKFHPQIDEKFPKSK